VKGNQPFDYVELTMMIREFEARRPSDRLASASYGETTVPGNKKDPEQSLLESVAKNRDISVSRLRQILTGELDWVVVKATAREPDRRYASVNDLADEVQRYIHGEAVEARPPSTAYRASKFIRRNKGLVASLSAIGALLIATTAISSVFAYRAEVARKETELQKKEAETNLKFAKQGNEILGSIFADLDPREEYQTVADLRAALQDNVALAVDKLDSSELADPLEVADMQLTLGVSLAGLGSAESALGLVEASYETHRELLGPAAIETLESQARMGEVLISTGHAEKAMATLRDCSKLSAKTHGPNHPLTITTRLSLAGALSSEGNFKESIKLILDVLDKAQSHMTEDTKFLAHTMTELGISYRKDNQLDLAVKYQNLALELRQEVLGDTHPDTIDSMAKLSTALSTTRQHSDAIKIGTKAVDLAKRHLGELHPRTLQYVGNLGALYAKVDAKKSKELLEEVYFSKVKKLGVDHPVTLFSMENVASINRMLGNFEVANDFAKRNFELTSAKFGESNRFTLNRGVALARILLAEKKYGQAIEVLIPIVENMEEFLGEEDPYTMKTADLLAGALEKNGQLDEAITMYQLSLKKFSKVFGDDNPETLITASLLAKALRRAKRYEEAVLVVEDAIEKWESRSGRESLTCQKEVLRLGRILVEMGSHDDGIALLEEVVVASKRFPELSSANDRLRESYLLAKKKDKFHSIALVELEMVREKYPPGSLELASQLAKRGFEYLQIGSPERAEAVLKECVGIRSEKKPDAWNTSFAKVMLGKSLMDLGNLTEAKTWLVTGYEELVEKSGQIPEGSRSVRFNETMDWLIELAGKTDDQDQQEKWETEKKKLNQKLSADTENLVP